MWTSKFKNIDKNGLRPDLKVTVEFTDGQTVYEKEYNIFPSDLKSDSFAGMVQEQIDILNAKDDVVTTTDIAVDKAVPIIKLL